MLVWLMVLAVPLQGVAGTAMQHCADRVEQAVQAPAAAAHHAHGPRAAHAAMVADVGHHHGAADHGVGSAPAGHQHSSAPAADHQCSACAACCSALGLPSRVVSLIPPRVAAAANALPGPAVESFVPARLDRPPRSPAA